jgi:hypothetical protein
MTGFRAQPDGVPVIDKAIPGDLDYTEDWSAWLATGETITAAAWTVPTGISAHSPSFTITSATTWLSGGTTGTVYVVSCTITTSASRIDTRSFKISVRFR